MTANIYKNVQASLRTHFYNLYNSVSWYIDSTNDNMTEDTFIELRSSMGRAQDDLKDTLRDFAQISIYSTNIATLDTAMATIIAGLEGSGAINVMNYAGEEPSTKLGELQITRYELSPQMNTNNYTHRAITVYYELKEEL
jgi:hypothetical protein